MAQRPEIIRTDAVVLHSMEYGETSRILQLLTRERGKMGVIVKGARTPSSRFGTTLDPMAAIQAVIHIKPGRSLQLLTETSHLRSYGTTRSSLDRIRIGLKVVELTRSIAQEEQRFDELFSLVISTLTTLDQCEDRPGNLWPFFQLRCAVVLGFGPSFDSDVVRGLDSDSGMLDLDTGWIAGPHSPDSPEGTDAPVGHARTRGSRRALRAFAVFARADLSDVLRMEVEPPVMREVEALVASYMKMHIQESYPSRSARVFAQFGLEP